MSSTPHRVVAQAPAWVQRASGPNLHYGWIIAFLGMATVFACLGIARFSLGMLLPSMRSDLTLSYTDMGWISTGNFVGYLVAALLCGRLVKRWGARAVVFGALLTIAASLLVVASAASVALIWPAYLVTGLGSGSANVAVMSLVPYWFSRRWRGRAAGIMVIGSGPAIMLSGLLIPAITDRWGAAGWRIGWVCLSAVVFVVAMIVGTLIRNRPEELGLVAKTHARDDVVASPAAALQGAAGSAGRAGRAGRAASRGSRGTVAHLAVIYCLFGFTYIIYATFIVTLLVQERGFSERTAGHFWFAVGALSLCSGPVFGALSDRAGRRIGMAVVFVMHSIAYGLIGLHLATATIYLSIALFGLAAWSIPGIIAAAVGDYMGPAQAANTLGTLTVAFGAGQSLGPIAAGVLAERTGVLEPAFLMACVLAAIAVLLCLALRPPPTGGAHG